jgi:hypothetical protein
MNYDEEDWELLDESCIASGGIWKDGSLCFWDCVYQKFLKIPTGSG